MSIEILQVQGFADPINVMDKPVQPVEGGPIMVIPWVAPRMGMCEIFYRNENGVIGMVAGRAEGGVYAAYLEAAKALEERRNPPRELMEYVYHFDRDGRPIEVSAHPRHQEV